jgi:hypothetical protein
LPAQVCTLLLLSVTAPPVMLSKAPPLMTSAPVPSAVLPPVAPPMLIVPALSVVPPL